MGELIAATESVSPVMALIYPFIPVLILLGFYFAAGGGFNDDDDDDFGGGKGIHGQWNLYPFPFPSGAYVN